MPRAGLNLAEHMLRSAKHRKAFVGDNAPDEHEFWRTF